VTDIQVGKRFVDAANWAAELHAGASGTRTPSVAQVLGVASLIFGDGGTSREAIAGMIVDADADDLDDGEVRDRLGQKAARLVAASAEALRDPGRLDDETDGSVLRVCAAVTLRGVQELQRDLRRHGSVAFARFSSPPAATLDRNRDLVAVFRRRLGGSSILTAELRAAVAELERDAELETAVAAWRVAHIDVA
jgi:hypothetical protein